MADSDPISTASHPGASSLAPPPAYPGPALPTLKDAWPGSRPFTLDRFFERGQFRPLLMVVLVLIAAFLLYQLVGALALALGAVMQAAGSTEPLDAMDLMTSVMENAGVLLGGNAIGQVVGFAVLVLLVVRFHTREAGPFLRLRAPDMPGLGLAVVGWMVLYPGLLWLGQINSLLPQPEWLQKLEEAQVEMIETALLNSSLGAPFLLLTMALTPAICEELLFRGYLQRQMERGLGLVWSIVGIGVLFGLYHLRLTQFVPLAVLGTYFGFVTWATGSLYTAMLIHFLNNGLAVLIAMWARGSETLDMEALEAVGVPWYLAIVSLVAAGVVVLLLKRRREAVAPGPDAAPVPAPSLSAPLPIS